MACHKPLLLSPPYPDNPPPNKELKPEPELPEDEEDAAPELLEPLELDVEEPAEEIFPSNQSAASLTSSIRRAVDFDLVLRVARDWEERTCQCRTCYYFWGRGFLTTAIFLLVTRVAVQDDTGHSALDIVVELADGTRHHCGALTVAAGRDDGVRALAVRIVEHLLGLVQGTLRGTVRKGILGQPGGRCRWPAQPSRPGWGKLRTNHIADFGRTSGEDEGVGPTLAILNFVLGHASLGEGRGDSSGGQRSEEVSKKWMYCLDYFHYISGLDGDFYNTSTHCLSPKSLGIFPVRRDCGGPETLDWLHIQHEASRFSCVFTHSVSKFSAKTLGKVYVPRHWHWKRHNCSISMCRGCVCLLS
ncbi:hypothetical protein KC349_g13 [Hortaea werneckii]|nr:hypothetical protein KC349_g13 [Hortaea werneckii]